MKATYLLSLLLLASPVVAAGPECNYDGTQSEMNACAAQEFDAADAELNQVYRDVMKEHSDYPLFIEKLKAAQRQWLKFRDADLDARFPLTPDQDPRVEFGSMYPMEYASAKTELTRARTSYLRTHWLDSDGH